MLLDEIKVGESWISNIFGLTNLGEWSCHLLGWGNVDRADLRLVVVEGRNQKLVFGQVKFEMTIRYMHRDVK